MTEQELTDDIKDGTIAYIMNKHTLKMYKINNLIYHNNKLTYVCTDLDDWDTNVTIDLESISFRETEELPNFFTPLPSAISYMIH